MTRNRKKKDRLWELSNQVLEQFEREGDQYLIQVYTEGDLGYSWVPVTEEMIELLYLLAEELSTGDD